MCPSTWACATGGTRVVGVPMAPQFSTLSVQKYVDAATAALPDGVRLDAVRSFHSHPLLLEAFAERVRAAAPHPDELVVFTAHSLPVRVIESGDQYAAEVAATARGVSSSCPSASSATTRRSCSTSTCRPQARRAKRARRSAAPSRSTRRPHSSARSKRSCATFYDVCTSLGCM